MGRAGGTSGTDRWWVSARRDAVVLAIVIAAVFLLIWNGSAFFHEIALAREIGASGRIAGVALTLNVALIIFGWRRYVDLQHEAEKRLEGERRAAIAASTDPVTGLLNRKGFAEKTGNLCAAVAGRGQVLLVLSLQLHRTKSASDRHGHAIGDTLLRCIADSLQSHFEGRGVVGRLGGDDFAVALAMSPSEAEQGANHGRDLLRLASRPFEIEGRVIQSGAFVGMAVARPDEVHIPDLLRRADIAMDHAKSGRLGRPVWFDAAMERALIAHTEVEQGILVGLENGQFVPFFEPQIDLRSGELVGFEVLARWIHPLSGVISPEVFIPVAEEMGAINRLSEQVIRAALVHASEWDPAIKISVNISPAQLTDGWLAERIVRLLTETGFPAERLVVEITETSLFSDIDLARSLVGSLKNQGIRVALDDFGTGFSSLSHLRSLPFDLIKIDRSFVRNIHSSEESEAIVRAVVTLADALRVPVLVEGIESEAAHAVVLGIGCAVGQGWYFGKPVDAEQASRLLAPPAPRQDKPARGAASL